MKRDLHKEQAIQCIDFDDVQPKLIQSQRELLTSHRLFEIRKWILNEPREAPGRAIHDRLLSHRKSQLCQSRICAGRIFSRASAFRRPATETAGARHHFVAHHNSGVEAAVSAAKTKPDQSPQTDTANRRPAIPTLRAKDSRARIPIFRCNSRRCARCDRKTRAARGAFA